MFDQNNYENPFKSTNADSMSYEQIVDSWSAPFFMKRIMLTEDFYLRTPMSLIISGARGTGKTMMFKYYSFQAQAILAQKKNKSIIEHFKLCKSISMYLKFDPYFLQAFEEDNVGISIFTHFFELIVCESYVEFIQMLYEKNELDTQTYNVITEKIYNLLGRDDYTEGLANYVEDRINEVYGYINERKISGVEFQTSKLYHFKNLSYKVKEIICQEIVEFQDVIFLLVIDEGENFLEFEQKLLNGFIKTLNSRMNRDIFLRLGTRAPEIKTFETINKEEFLTIGRDYEFKDINYYTIESGERQEYKKWLAEIARNRLLSVPVFREQGLGSIQTFLGEKEEQCEEAKKWAANKKDHFKWCLKNQYTDRLYEKLRVKDNPLLEMMNIWCFKKGYSIKEIQIGMNAFLNGSSGKNEYRDIEKRYRDRFYDNKVAFLYLLSSKYKREKQYYSFNTYSYLSVGNVCNFIKLCREAFDNAYFEDRQKLFYGHISKKSQHAAAMSVAYDEIEKIKYIPKVGNELYALVVNLGNLFSQYHADVDLKVVESNQFSVTTNDKAVSELIGAALTWGVFLKKNKLQTLGPSGSKGTVYTLNRMFCPLFGISYRSKGRSIEVLDKDTFLILTEIQKRNVLSVISTNQEREHTEQQIPGQITLFFDEEECE